MDDQKSSLSESKEKSDVESEKQKELHTDSDEELHTDSDDEPSMKFTSDSRFYEAMRNMEKQGMDPNLKLPPRRAKLNHKLINAIELTDEIPRDIHAARRSINANQWLKAIDEEMKSINDNNVFELVNLPIGKKPIGVKWVFDVKKNEMGEIVRYKARLVAKGYTQLYGTDYLETYAPVAHSESLRLFLVLAFRRKSIVKHWDFCTAFLAGSLEEEIWMRQPPGYDDGSGKVWKLKKSLYGLKQASRAWNTKLVQVLVDLGFLPLISDPCFFIQGENMIIIHVDDILCASPSQEESNFIFQQLEKYLKLKDMGNVKFFLGIQIDRVVQGFILSQKSFVEDLLISTSMHNSKPVSTPMENNDAIFQDEFTPVDTYPFREVLGKLNYLAITTRPDISYSVSVLSRYSNQYGEIHWQSVKRVLPYLPGKKK